MDLKSTHHRGGQSLRHKCSPPPPPPGFFRGRAGAAAMTRSPARLPLLRAMATLALAMTLLFSPVQAQEGSGPAKPTGLSATASHDRVVLTWDGPNDDSITGYVILRRNRQIDRKGEFRELVQDTGTAATTYIDDRVAAGTPYTYRIKAINKHGVSERSRWVHIDTPAAPEAEAEQSAEPPARPTGISATASHDSVVLTWDDPGNDSITGYVILRRVRVNDTGGDFSVLVADTGTAARPARARRPAPAGRTSGSSRAPYPPPRQGFNASNGNEQVTLTWDAPAADADITRHEYRFKTTGDYPAVWTEIDDSAPGGAHEDWVVVTGLTNDVAYTFQLRAANADGAGTAAEAGPVTPKSGFCGRTEEVRNKIMRQSPVNGVLDCADVTTTQLAGVTGLPLNNEGIRSLQPDDFSGLTALTYLFLNNNELSSLPTGVFSDLSALDRLFLASNELSSLPAGVFTGLTSLELLSLDNNELRELPDDVFSGLTALQDLYLSDNELVSLTAGAFSSLSSLDRLHLSENKLSSLPDDVFSDLSALRFLILTNNELSSLTAGVFTGLEALDKLYLAHNELSSLTADAFSGLSALELLYLDNNDLRSLPDGVFSGLTALTALKLGDNPNTGDLLPLSVTLVTLENGGSDQVRAKVLAGAPFTVDIPVTVANGALDGDATELRVAAGSVEGTPVTVTRTPGTTAPVTVDIDLTSQPSLPGDHDGYIFVVEGADLPANATTSGVVKVDGSGARSTIAAPVAVRDDEGEITGYTFDTDWFAVELEADRTYRIDMKGSVPTNELTLRLPQINAIYDADGGFLVNTFSRDESSSHHLFRVTFHAHAGGTYYIAASGESFEGGSYELTVKDITPASKPAVASEPPGLAPNAPNPFNASTVIPYRLDADGPVRLEIYNLLGQRLRALVDEVQAVGAPAAPAYDARDGRGEAVAAGAQEGAVPAEPTGLSTVATFALVHLTWDDPGDATITGYQVFRRARDTQAQGEFSLIEANTGSAQTRYTDAGVQPETRYVYRVKAINEHGTGPRSGYVNAETPAAPEATLVPPPEPEPEPENEQEQAADPEPTPEPEPEPTPEPTPEPSDAESDRAGAHDLGDITGQTEAGIVRGELDDAGPVDYYRFTLEEPKSVGLGLPWLQANADLYLEDADGATLRARVFSAELSPCVACGGRLRILAPLTDPASVRRYLLGIGLPALAPPPQFELAAGPALSTASTSGCTAWCALKGSLVARIDPDTGSGYVPGATKPYWEPCRRPYKRSSGNLARPVRAFIALTENPGFTLPIRGRLYRLPPALSVHEGHRPPGRVLLTRRRALRDRPRRRGRGGPALPRTDDGGAERQLNRVMGSYPAHHGAPLHGVR